jgi:hypothetical protein
MWDLWSDKAGGTAVLYMEQNRIPSKRKRCSCGINNHCEDHGIARKDILNKSGKSGTHGKIHMK